MHNVYVQTPTSDFTYLKFFYAEVNVYVSSRGRAVTIEIEASAGSEEERNAMADDAMKTVRNDGYFP